MTDFESQIAEPGELGRCFNCGDCVPSVRLRECGHAVCGPCEPCPECSED